MKSYRFWLGIAAGIAAVGIGVVIDGLLTHDFAVTRTGIACGVPAAIAAETARQIHHDRQTGPDNEPW